MSCTGPLENGVEALLAEAGLSEGAVADSERKALEELSGGVSQEEMAALTCNL